MRQPTSDSIYWTPARARDARLARVTVVGVEKRRSDDALGVFHSS